MEQGGRRGEWGEEGEGEGQLEGGVELLGESWVEGRGG